MVNVKVTVLFLTDKNDKEQFNKAKLLGQVFIKKENVTKLQESKNYLLIETTTHQIKIIAMDQSPRGHAANFIFDLSGFKEAQDTSRYKSTYTWSHANEVINGVVTNNGWE